MRKIYNGMPADELGAEGWEKPWSGPNGGSCVETKKVDDRMSPYGSRPTRPVPR